jgi:hypothetical protein
VAEMTAPDPVELSFWRTLYRYLLSIVGSLVCGAIWFGLTQGLAMGSVTLIPRVFHLGLYGTIFTGVLALSLGFILLGYLWLSIDLSRPAPDGVDAQARRYQLFVLWLGVPLAVMGVFALVAIAAVVVGATVYSSGLSH